MPAFVARQHTVHARLFALEAEATRVVGVDEVQRAHRAAVGRDLFHPLVARVVAERDALALVAQRVGQIEIGPAVGAALHPCRAADVAVGVVEAVPGASKTWAASKLGRTLTLKLVCEKPPPRVELNRQSIYFVN